MEEKASSEETIFVKVGLWKYAPFYGSISKGISRLNAFLKEKNLLVEYDLVSLDRSKRTDEFIAKKINILFFDGGEDLNPNLYGERNVYSHFSEKRDKEEFDIWRRFEKRINDGSILVSGVCRGHQLINVALGGSLYQDISAAGFEHISPHKVEIAANPKKPTLSMFVGNEEFAVSSLHHQAVKGLGRGLFPSLYYSSGKGENSDNDILANIHSLAYGEENIQPPNFIPKREIIEGLENKYSGIRSVQSHPEFAGHKNDSQLFAYLMFADKYLYQLESRNAHKININLDEKYWANRYISTSGTSTTTY